MGSCKKANSIYNEDRLSSLPESLIHHILSLLPSTKDAARTAVLSKSWRYKWHHVPNIIFLCRCYNVEDAQSFYEFAQKSLILYAGSQLEKFVIEFSYSCPKIKKLHPQMSKLIQFATLKAVKEVILCVDHWNFWLPQCFYNNTSLIKLKTRRFDFEPSGKVNWPSLKSLRIEHASNLTNEFMENIISGSPLLESLELKGFYRSKFDRLHIDSECLKRLALFSYCSHLKITGRSVEILEILGVYMFRVDIGIDLPSLVSCTIDFRGLGEGKYELVQSVVQSVVQQVMHAKELKLGICCLQALSFSKAIAISDSDSEEQRSTLSNIQCLMIEGSISPSFSKYVPGIMSLLRMSPKLEKLFIKLFPWDDEVSLRCLSKMRRIDQPDYGNISKNCLMLGNAIFTCLSSYLKTVEVIGLDPLVLGHQYKFSGRCESVLEFVEFLLRNGSVLEKIVLRYEMHSRLHKRDFAVKVSQWLSGIPGASPHVVIMLRRLKERVWGSFGSTVQSSG